MDKYYIKIELSRAQYEVLKEKAESAGYSSIVDYIRSLALAGASCTGQGLDEARVAQEISKRLERAIVDLLNPYTAKIDDINRKLSEIIESIEALSTQRPQEALQPGEAVPTVREQRQARKGSMTASERLRSEGVVFYSDVKWMRAPERLFQKLEREGALVFGSGDNLVAVDPQFWEDFKSEVESLSVRDSEEASLLIREKLGEKAGRLFERLVRHGVIIYDEDLDRWIIAYP